VTRQGVLVVSLDSTSGWRSAANELTGALERVGTSVMAVSTRPPPSVRTFALTDFTQARAARRAASKAIAQHAPAAIIYCSVTASLLWPAPGAIWLDSIAAENRPGRHGVWQRVVERRRLRQAPLVLAMSKRSLMPLRGPRPDVVVVPVPVEQSGPPASRRDLAALTYGGDPEKKRLGHVIGAWSRARRDGETLLVAGIDRLDTPEGVELAGRLPPEEYRALLRRTRLFVAAPRREDYGIAQLEALADGCLLATTPAPGPYPALDLARALDPRLVDDQLERAIRTALDDPKADYAEHAAQLLTGFSRAAVERTLAQRVLPRLAIE
jgi:hypothetical protein